MDFAFSFSSDANKLVSAIYAELSGSFEIYYYKNFLEDQVGLRLRSITEAVYSNVPTVFFVTEGWIGSEICQTEFNIAQESGFENLLLPIGEGLDLKNWLESPILVRFPRNTIETMDIVSRWFRASLLD